MIEDMLTPFICPRFLDDEQYRRGHIHILAAAPGTKIMGLHTPEMKKMAKELSGSPSSDAILDGFEAQLHGQGKSSLCHEERMVWGLMLDYLHCSLEERLARISGFIPSIDNWAICDNFCCNAKWMKKADTQRVRDFLDDLFGTSKKDENYEFSVRTALILSMCRFLDADSIQITFAKIGSLDLREDEPYYVRMAAAWLFATALAKDPEKTRKFVVTSHLPNDIVKLYVRKARESGRTKEVRPL